MQRKNQEEHTLGKYTFYDRIFKSDRDNYIKEKYGRKYVISDEFSIY